MSRELLVLILSWVASILLLVWRVEKSKRREIQIVFLFTQTLGWIYVFIQVYFDHLVFPFREFPKATDMLLSLHFIIYPTFIVFFVMYYPKTKVKWKIFLYWALFIAGHQLYETILENYTNIIEAKHWKWYWGLLVKTFIYFVIYRFYLWFRKGLGQRDRLVVPPNSPTKGGTKFLLSPKNPNK
jgi:hypothetical protein